ncbi:Acyl-CoA synthetase (AMP-forming)/AMP-acid ligase II [Acinetobacter marinus]|uniref:Acyl-CoA synthetase (AMP-forming)/AMP-acid ligase II n=1 Tax=Acinetobacter marinus TaxID=281375 RepID=A0A1G6M3P8_9GAMM|nr:AMP-binding protein [Acinetobacter marinus]SDC50129.1 Acyl-CoA synthetase (AMP-forming)/AMP-acid ligase II [Acinetobacter marinus]
MIVANLRQYFHHPQVLAFSKNSRISHAEFWHMVCQRQAFLLAQDQTDYALWLEDSAEFLAWIFASTLAEKTVYLPPHRVKDLERQFQDQGIVFIEQDWSNKVVQTDTTAFNDERLAQDLEAHLESTNLIFYTSGSTGEAKHIPRSLAQLLAEVHTSAVQLKWQQPFCMLASVSHQHIYGLLFQLLLPLITGQAFYREQVVYPEYLEDIQQFIADQEVALDTTQDSIFDITAQRYTQYLVASPALLKRCIGEFRFAHATRIFSSGGLLDAEIRQHYPQTITEVLGSTETGGMATRDQDHAPWQAMADVEIRIDESQQLWIKTAHAYQQDWLATGDLAEVLPEGFRLLGRADRIVKLEEKRISLTAVEQAIDGLASVEMSKAFLIQQGNRTRLATVVALDQAGMQMLRKQGKLHVVQQLKAKLSDTLESIALPRQWRFVSQMPRNTQSKINMQQLHTLFETQHFPLELQPVQVDQHAHDDSAQSRYPHRVQYQLQFSPELICFQGHFSDLPIYPGVGQIAFLVEYIERHWTDFDFCTGFEQLKFQDIIRPYDVITLQLTRVQDKVSFQMIDQDEKKVASGRLKFALKHSG